MTDSEIERFIAALKESPELLAELDRLRHDPAAAARLAAARGYGLTRADAETLFRSLDALASDELSDDELDQAAGGAWNDPPPPGGTG